MSCECSFAALDSSESTLSASTPCWLRAPPISARAEETAAEELNCAGADVPVVGGGTTGLVGAVGGGLAGGGLGDVGEVGDVGLVGVVGFVGEGCDWVGCGGAGREEVAEELGVCPADGDGLEPVPAAAEVAVLVGVAGLSGLSGLSGLPGLFEDELAGAVTVTNPGAASPPSPGAIGAIRYGAPSRIVELVSAGPPCRIPGPTKANAAIAAVDRLPIAIGAGRSGLNGLRARWRAL